MKAVGIGLFIYIAIVLFLLAGWVQCIIKFVSCDFDAPYKAEIIYGVGVCTGLGGIVGWFNIEDGAKMTTPAPASPTQ